MHRVCIEVYVLMVDKDPRRLLFWTSQRVTELDFYYFGTEDTQFSVRRYRREKVGDQSEQLFVPFVYLYTGGCINTFNPPFFFTLLLHSVLRASKVNQEVCTWISATV